MLEKLREGLQNAIKKIIGATSIDEQTIKEFVRDLQRTLLQADVNVKQVFELSSKIEKRALGEAPPPGLPRKDHIVKILYDEFSNVLGSEGRLDLPVDRSNLILLMGVQGSGKTTVTAKLARFYQKKGYKASIVCADTFRPGAFAQLKTLGSSIGVEVFGDENETESIRIAGKGVEYFQAKGKNPIIIDTAGRHKEEKGLLEEMRVVSGKIKPDITLLILDGTIGQACYAQSEAFHKAVPVGGIIITKLDGAAKGGGALAAAAATGARIVFIGTGERVDDLEIFSATRFVGRLLGLGDLRTLLDRAKELEAEADEKKIQRIMSGRMTIDDLYYQFEQVKKMGSLRKIFDLIPGLSSAISSQDVDGLEEKMVRWKSIIQSMTREEKENPEILGSSRIRRIARGSGRGEKEVKEMLARYRQTKSVMKASRGRAIRQMLRRFSPHEG